MKDFNQIKRKKNLNEAGKVIIGPYNIITSPAKAGHFNASVGHLFNRPFEHMLEEYDRASMLEKFAKAKASKLCAHENPFKNSGPGGKPLTKVVWMNRTKFPVSFCLS